MDQDKLDRIVICSNASILRKFDYGKIHKVFYPQNETDIKKAIAYAVDKDLSITSKGGGSGLSGACTGGNRDRIFISSYRLKKIHQIDLEKEYAWVSSGLTPDEINKVLEKYNYKFNISPSSREMATIGGLISTDGGGNDSWLHGTMRDNTLAAELLDTKGQKFIVTHDASFSDVEHLDKKLKNVKLTMNDLASSHGTLGFIHKLKIKITKIKPFQNLISGYIQFNCVNALGRSIVSLIEKNVFLPYSEAISYVMPEMRDKAKSPILILKTNEAELSKIRSLPGDFKLLNQDEFEQMYKIRRSYPKMNPPKGTQFALFEGFGYTKKHLMDLKSIQDEIHQLLANHHIKPFGKYGHAPSKWYGEDNQPKYGYIQHSREVPSHKMTAKEVLAAVIGIVNLCKRMDITPKPEHKWWLMKQKRNRLMEIKQAIDEENRFNSWIIDTKQDNLSDFV